MTDEQYLDDKRKNKRTLEEEIEDLWQAIRQLEQKINRVKNGLDNLSQFI